MPPSTTVILESFHKNSDISKVIAKKKKKKKKKNRKRKKEEKKKKKSSLLGNYTGATILDINSMELNFVLKISISVVKTEKKKIK